MRTEGRNEESWDVGRGALSGGRRVEVYDLEGSYEENRVKKRDRSTTHAHSRECRHYVYREVFPGPDSTEIDGSLVEMTIR